MKTPTGRRSPVQVFAVLLTAAGLLSLTGPDPAHAQAAAQEQPVPAPAPCSSPDCPEPPLWQPEIQQGYNYSEPDVCTDKHISRDAEVVLQDNETLGSALDRLADAVRGRGGSGGRILVPWDTETVQCDSLRLRGRQRKTLQSLALSGIRGPDGQLPRFYCRAEKMDGTIPKGSRSGRFFTGPGLALLENIEVNGYGSWANTGFTGKFVARNNYFHGATNDGFSNSGLDWGKHEAVGPREAEFCGNNISRGGQGNAKHCFYLHRGLPGSESTYRLVDNVIHSCNWSEGFKSTGEYNLISGNRFYKTVPPPEFQPGNPAWRLEESPERESNHYGNTLLNIVACSNSVVRNNLFHIYRPEPTGYASAHAFMVSGRRGLQGCDRPRGYIGDNKGARPNPGSEFWSRSYWDSIAGTYPFQHVVEGNTFMLVGPTHTDKSKNPKGIAIKMYGTYPAVAVRQFGASCLLETPPFWRERSRVVVRSDNRFAGFDLNPETVRFMDVNPGHSGQQQEAQGGGACLKKGYPFPATAALRESDKIVEIR